ncbi:DUF2271 domain-containing protein [Pseudomonas sp. NW5]|uniref:DUF2271 domain-containing protein n=1 Tax=Pseudomonas sp. NW5 TaxID=2934934 RepID=UPI00202280D0|nr:DUF2271 domain-containing protein [Pseudomonas sp. NW5]MCL7462861.1 DUF2271 domain-containing protein [Pseudomonas sp. NW5]
MHKTLATLALAGVSAAPLLAQAQPQPLTLDVTLKEYRGEGAYLAIYLTDADGQYQKTLWVAGKKAKYYRHLRDWSRGGGAQRAEYDGLTGASVGSGKNLTVEVELEPALLDAGYQIRIDSAVEDKRDNRAEVILPLTREPGAAAGSGYVDRASYRF